MRTYTPSEAIARLKGFIARVDRLKANDYSFNKSKVTDLNKLKNERGQIGLLISIAVHCKNPQSYKAIERSVKDAIAIMYDFD